MRKLSFFLILLTGLTWFSQYLPAPSAMATAQILAPILYNPYSSTSCGVAAVRGCVVKAFTAASATVVWPRKAASGDYCVIFLTSTGTINTPGGWSQQTSGTISTGKAWNFGAYDRTLNSTDISTGSVFVNTNGTWSYAIICMVGAGGGTRFTAENHSENLTSSPQSVSTFDGSTISSDVVFYFGSQLCTSGCSSSITTTRGTRQGQAAFNGVVNASISSETGVSGSLTQTWGYGATLSRNAQVFWVIKTS